MNIIYLVLFIPLLAGLIFCGCSSEVDNSSRTSSSQNTLSQSDSTFYLSEITALAKAMDKRFEDGWICRRNSRVLKSGYRIILPEHKAEFAMAYNEFLVSKNQNLAKSLDTYVPYSERFEFALSYWLKSKDKEKFLSESAKKKVVWLHESLLDASELYWRVFEKKNASIINNATVMAHDREQDMVFNYMEIEGKPSSFSNQYAKYASKFKQLDKSK